MNNIIYIFLVAFVVLETSVVALPLTLLLLLILGVQRRSDGVIVAAFFCGLALDILLLRPFGATSLFFLLYLFLVTRYTKKFEIASYYFIFGATATGTTAYEIIFYHTLSVQSILLSIFIAAIFFTLNRRRNKEVRNEVKAYSFSLLSKR